MRKQPSAGRSRRREFTGTENDVSAEGISPGAHSTRGVRGFLICVYFNATEIAAESRLEIRAQLRRQAGTTGYASVWVSERERTRPPGKRRLRLNDLFPAL